jgi:hypothetical protein
VTADPFGYSGTPLARKLGVAPESRVAAIGAPAGFAERLDGAVPRTRLTGGRFDVVIAFTADRAWLERRLPQLVAAREPRGSLWLAWPKRSSGVRTDVTEDGVRELGLATGLVDNKVCAIDATWSALRFVSRRPR